MQLVALFDVRKIEVAWSFQAFNRTQALPLTHTGKCLSNDNLIIQSCLFDVILPTAQKIFCRYVFGHGGNRISGL